jgi:hypothetical protein
MRLTISAIWRDSYTRLMLHPLSPKKGHATEWFPTSPVQAGRTPGGTYTHLFGGTVWHQVRRGPGGMEKAYGASLSISPRTENFWYPPRSDGPGSYSSNPHKPALNRP